MRARVAALATAVLTAAGVLAAFTPGPASAQGASFPGSAAFSGYSVGALEHFEALDNTTNQRAVNVDAPLSTAAFNSQGLGGIQGND